MHKMFDLYLVQAEDVSDVFILYWSQGTSFIHNNLDMSPV